MFNDSIKGGYRLIDSQTKSTYGLTITALKSAWDNLSTDEKLKSAIILNDYIFPSASRANFEFGCIDIDSNATIQILSIREGKYIVGRIQSNTNVTYTDYSSTSNNKAIDLIVFN